MKSAKDRTRADIQWSNVRFGSKADITQYDRDIDFAPECGHSEAWSACPLRTPRLLSQSK
jgi:hypothetical protein